MFSGLIERLWGFIYSRDARRLWWTDNSHQVIFRGNHELHILLFTEGVWQCDCETYENRTAAERSAWCRHSIAIQRILTAIGAGTALVCQAELVRCAQAKW